nr:reverse transcriptase domain-containing protein [Tanacetum cinerariifolium]
MNTNKFTNYMKANDAILKNMQTNMTSLTNSNLELKNMFGQFKKMNTASSLGSGTLPSNTITNSKEGLKGITTQSGTTYQGLMIPTTSSSLHKIVERETEVTKDTVPPTNNRSTKDVQTLVVQAETPMPNSEPIVAPIIELVVASLPKKLGDPGKFLIPCDFLGMDECLALADLGAIIKLMPLSVWNKLSFPELSPTCMTLELADPSITRPVEVAEDVFVKVGTFHFPADFVVVDFDANPRVPLILRRSFLKTERALIDVFKGELTLRVGKEAITFNLDPTSRYSANYNDMMAYRIEVIDMACEEYSYEVLSFFDVITSGNPTLYYDPIVSTSSPTLTPFGDSDFLLEEGDILLLEAFLNDDPSLPPPNQEKYLPQVQKELKICEAKNDKSSINEPPEVELKDLSPHLEYAYLEGDNKLAVIIAKDLSDEKKTALIKEDFKPAVQHHRSVNPKIHDVIKKEVEKLLDVGLIYPISDSPWGYIQIPIGPKDQEKTTFMCPYGTFAYRRMPSGLCNALGTLQRCMIAIFHDMIEKMMEVFMDNFSVFGNSFETCLSHFEKMLKRCEDTNLCLNWEKSHFIVKEGIFLGHKISKNMIKVDKAKVDVIAKLPHPTT